MNSDPDPGGSKTCGFGSGSGSPTLLVCLMSMLPLFIPVQTSVGLTFETLEKFESETGVNVKCG
jgi:hypothetical protein